MGEIREEGLGNDDRVEEEKGRKEGLEEAWDVSDGEGACVRFDGQDYLDLLESLDNLDERGSLARVLY